MEVFITITTIVHATLFYIDEYILHKERGLTRKEINSSLIDGVLFLILVAMTLFTPFNEITQAIFISLAGLSCLSIIKNELFYPEVLSRKERLIHSGLYVLHALILYAFYASWEMNFFKEEIYYWMLQLCYFVLGFKAVSYHLIYWNYIYPYQKLKN